VDAQGAVIVHPVRPATWGISLRQQRRSLFDALLYKKHPELYQRKIQPSRPWDYYAIVAAVASAWLGSKPVAWMAAPCWAWLTARFCVRRLRRTSLAPGHVAEMVVTSLAIPFLSVFWRLYGAWKFRARFF